MTVSAVASLWNPALLPRFDGNWSSFTVGNAGSGAATEGGSDSAAGTGILGRIGSGATTEAAGDTASGTGAGVSTDVTKILKFQSLSGGVNGANVNVINPFGTCKYSNAVLEGSDTTSMALIGTAGSTAFGYSFSFTSANDQAKRGDTYWFSVRMFRPTGFNDIGSGHLKFFRIRTYHAGGGALGYDDVYLSGINEQTGTSTPSGCQNFIYESDPINPGGTWANFNQTTHPLTGAWETWDYQVTFDNNLISGGGTARVRLWRNKVLVGEITTKRTLNLGTDYAADFHHTTYWNGGCPANQTMYVNKFAMAAQIAGVRDDTPWMTTDSNGFPLIAVGL